MERLHSATAKLMEVTMSGVKELFQGEGGKVAARAAGYGVGAYMGVYVGLTILTGGAAGVLPIVAGAAAVIGGLCLSGHSNTVRKRSEAAAGKSFKKQDWTGFLAGMLGGIALINMVNVKALVAPTSATAGQKTAITAPAP